MRIGIIGVGNIGGALAKHFASGGHQVAVSNSRGADTLRSFAAELGEGARAVAPQEAAEFGDIVVVSVPFGRYRELPRDGVAGKVVIDTNNYYPNRDGQFQELDNDRTTSSELLQEHMRGSRVVKAFNGIAAANLRDSGRPGGDSERIGIPISSDDAEAKRVVADLIDEIGFDAVDAGTLAEGGAEARTGHPGICQKLHHQRATLAAPGLAPTPRSRA